VERKTTCNRVLLKKIAWYADTVMKNLQYVYTALDSNKFKIGTMGLTRTAWVMRYDRESTKQR
jgi:hypothetical protein